MRYKQHINNPTLTTQLSHDVLRTGPQLIYITLTSTIELQVRPAVTGTLVGF